MKDFSKYISRIRNSLQELEENSNLVKKAKYNKKIIEDLEVEIKVSKQRKLETLELINQTIQDIEKLIDKQNIKD
tara:strand:+ start:527 stop:751 length:225 start_codon:yes stop_codon:yes gene_type:complete